MAEFTNGLESLKKRLAEAEEYLGLQSLRGRQADLEPEMAAPDLWDDANRARSLTTEYGQISDDISTLERLAGQIEDAETLLELAAEEGDDSVTGEVAEIMDQVSADLDVLDLRSLFTGEYDECDAVCEIHAGEGGTDAQDWAEMMLRMYLRWAERRGFGVELDEVTEGQEAGILSATFIVKGRHAYGWLNAERGVHRLYRISPFDSQARRQTSYAAVDVIPFVEDTSDQVEIDDKELRIDVYRSSGAGGQHVNVTDSAVRITHLPTGIVVSCQNERSQLQNKARAMQVLVAKLAERARAERAAELAALGGPQGQVSRAGSFIRGYVLAPYQKVKDERSGHETGNVEAVLDGDLDPFMEAYLRWRRASAN